MMKEFGIPSDFDKSHDDHDGEDCWWEDEGDCTEEDSRLERCQYWSWGNWCTEEEWCYADIVYDGESYYDECHVLEHKFGSGDDHHMSGDDGEDCWWDDEGDCTEEHEEFAACTYWSWGNECDGTEECWASIETKDGDYHYDTCEALQAHWGGGEDEFCDDYACYYDSYYCEHEGDCYDYEGDWSSDDECGEMECEFIECEDDEHVYGEGTCWKEVCWNECGEEDCLMWHATGQDEFGQWTWID